MEGGLAHEMEVEMGNTCESVGEALEFLGGQALFLSCGFMAKGAGEIADIGDFKISFLNHI